APLARYRSDDPPADAAAAAAASDRADAAANDNVRPRFAGRLVVLVDRGTQGPAEVLATVLRQRADATLVGEQTFGHAGRQTLIALSNGGRLLLTDAFYAGPDGTPLHEPLEPDERVRIFDQLQLGDDDTVDPVLDRAIELLRDDASAGDALDRAA
ncbi:MAG: S41 family peptidase, partial [Acidobacteriota bacterium]